MKWLTIGVLLNFFFAAPVLSELTKEDLQAIRAIVKEEIAESEARTNLKFQLLTTRIDEMDKRLTASITDVDKRLTNRISSMDERLTNSISSMDKRFTNSISSMDKRFTNSISSVDKRLGFLQTLVVVLITAVIGVPTGIFIYLEKRTVKGNKESQGEDSSHSQEILAHLQERDSRLETR